VTTLPQIARIALLAKSSALTGVAPSSIVSSLSGDQSRAIAYGEKRRIHVSRPVCSEQVFASETLPILPGENDPGGF
jgi:hypothetical protein